jgi:hypothetical protein
MPAAAHSYGTATGTFGFVSDTTKPIGQAGGNTFIREVAAIAYTGDLAGVADATDILVAHSDGTVDGYGTEICRGCTIGGRRGTFTAFFKLHIAGDQVTGTEVFLHGSGGLAGLQGGGPFHAGPAGATYAYKYRFTRG